jgi:hypothetical protein
VFWNYLSLRQTRTLLRAMWCVDLDPEETQPSVFRYRRFVFFNQLKRLSICSLKTDCSCLLWHGEAACVSLVQEYNCPLTQAASSVNLHQTLPLLIGTDVFVYSRQIQCRLQGNLFRRLLHLTSCKYIRITSMNCQMHTSSLKEGSNRP